ncbi:MAG TPA: ankyrin repeat domain-containing protein [Candidatus Dormibacteraeota bacterium]|jgi:ankyrin repeat protein|nr:ankyrin repeat domain-containing protein [Candidatus Dormibacteraeota bacterium]
MSDALPLPPHPNLEQYRKLAKDLQRACKSETGEAIRQWAERWAERVAELHGRPAAEFQAHAQRVQSQWRKMRDSNGSAARCSLAGAQFFLARCHGFVSWPKFAKHLEALERAGSPASTFETAADAIISGDVPALQKLLNENPGLVQERSMREHRSTLLQYVSANGVEDFRQKTPKNIVEIATLLLNAGAEVNAESDAYGGHSTALNLTATSCHPEDAGVQIPLMKLLLDRGAAIGANDVIACLHNGRGQAAAFLANSGARLDLEGAAGTGRLDVVRAFFSEDSQLKQPATPEQMKKGFAWACEFGRTAVVDFLLQRGASVHEKLPHHGQTGLHWAAWEGHAETVKLLLSRGASVDAVDDAFGGTPLGWALYHWANSASAAERGSFHETVALLARAGAKLESDWFEVDDDERQHIVRKLRSDPRMMAALDGKMLQ